MTEYIAKRKAKEAVDYAIELSKSEYDMMCAAINQIPAADVAPIVHAKWIDLYMTETDSCGEVVREEKDIYFMCSNCECIYSKRHSCQGEFCARCGAKMDLEDD